MNADHVRVFDRTIKHLSCIFLLLAQPITDTFPLTQVICKLLVLTQPIMLNDISFRCDTFIGQIFPSYFHQIHKNKNFQPSFLHGIDTWVYIHPRRVKMLTNYNMKNPVAPRNSFLHHKESQNQLNNFFLNSNLFEQQSRSLNNFRCILKEFLTNSYRLSLYKISLLPEDLYTHLNWPKRQTEMFANEGKDWLLNSIKRNCISHNITSNNLGLSRLRPSPAGNVTRMSNVQKYIHSLPSHTAPGGIQDLLLHPVY